MNKQEDFQNRALALLLRQQGLTTDFEQRAGRRRMDVVANLDGLRIVLEAETGFHRKAQAIKDADARLRQGLTVAVFAVCYPDGVTEENLGDATLTWTLRLKPGDPSGEWTTGSAAMLASAVRQAPNSLSGADIAAQKLSDALDAAVGQISANDHRSLAKALDLPANKPGTGESRSTGSGYRVAAKRGLLVAATAMLFHHRLQGHLPVLRPAGYEGEWPPASAVGCAEQSAVISAFQESWRGILAVDYRPVFETGRAALAALANSPDTSLAVRNLATVVSQISEEVAGLRHDLLGRIFHRVLDTARYDGSYYTSTSAAVLLASLAIREQDADWTDPNAVARLRICDPACGTGTLLMAVAERIRDLRNAAGQVGQGDEAALGRALVEDVLWGYDSNLTATHMAASALGMLSPATQFSRINIHRVRLGVVDGVAYVGSLEFLTGQARLADWPGLAERVEGDAPAENVAPCPVRGRYGRGGSALQSNLPPPMDLVIMNPPFTRDSLRYDQFSVAEELGVKQREKKLFGATTAHLAGSSGAFLVLAERICKSDAGAIAAVLPLSGITDKAGFEIRKQLGSQYHVETIVSSHDPERIYFSENTTIGEALIVCRRWNGDSPKPPTRVVNLARNPATPLESLDTAARIERAWGPGSPPPRDFTIQQVDAGRIASGDWSAVNFLSPFLTTAYRALSEDSPATVPSVPLNKLAGVGPAGQRIRDAYTNSNMPTASGRRALWHHKAGVIQSMLAETDAYIEPKPSERARRLADSYWEQRGNLLLPTQLRLNTMRVAAVMLPESALGSRWVPCRPHDPSIVKPLCLYLNSTPGLLSLLGERDNRAPSYPSFSLDTLRSLPVPDFTALGEPERDMLTGWFDWLQHETLHPFPQMANDPVRAQIDDAVVQALGLDAGWVATIRRELSREPSVTDKRTA